MNVGNKTIGLNSTTLATASGMIFIKTEYNTMPAPLPKPDKTTSPQDNPYSCILGSTLSAKALAKTSTSCRLSRSLFSKVPPLRKYHDAFKTSGASKSSWWNPSDAVWFGHDKLTSADLLGPVKFLRNGHSASGLSPSHTTSLAGFSLPIFSCATGNGPSELMAATLCPVNNRANHSCFICSFSLSSSAFFWASALIAICLASSLTFSSAANFSSSKSVGKIIMT
mmetsp:Transcript_14793/g.34864  ORF Transcript_14793/g.34864 Transcript_14793/m.34864 type:complete len:225 (+) Transcript_14793:421-1095(+)